MVRRVESVMSAATPDPCAFCRVGSCGVHHVLRVVPHTHPGMDEEAMVEVGCCDQLEHAVRTGFMRRDPERVGALYMQSRRVQYTVHWCPFCGARR